MNLYVTRREMIKHTVWNKDEYMFAKFDCWPLKKVIINAIKPNFFVHSLNIYYQNLIQNVKKYSNSTRTKKKDDGLICLLLNKTAKMGPEISQMVFLSSLVANMYVITSLFNDFLRCTA